MEETKTTQTSSVKLTKGQNDKFGWEIRISNDNLDEAIEELERVNNLMKEKFKREKK